MSYHTVLLMDEKLEIEGIFTIQTSGGNVVLVAEKGQRFKEFLDLAAQMVKPSGKKVGSLIYKPIPSSRQLINC